MLVSRAASLVAMPSAWRADAADHLPVITSSADGMCARRWRLTAAGDLRDTREVPGYSASGVDTPA